MIWTRKASQDSPIHLCSHHKRRIKGRVAQGSLTNWRPPLNSGRASSPVLSGNIGSSASGGASRSGARQTVGGIKVETRYVAQFKYSIMFSVIFRYSGVDTLDEPVLTTIVSSCGCFCFRLFTMLLQARDLLSIYSKLVQVLYPRRATGREVLRCFNSSSYTTLLLK